MLVIYEYSDPEPEIDEVRTNFHYSKINCDNI